MKILPREEFSLFFTCGAQPVVASVRPQSPASSGQPGRDAGTGQSLPALRADSAPLLAIANVKPHWYRRHNLLRYNVMDVLQTIRNVRRGQRIAYSLPLIIHWSLSRGIWREIPAKTKTLSYYGCLLECAAPIPVTDQVVVESVEKKRRVLARVVYRTLNQGNATTEIAVEFMDKIDFWELDFGMA